MKSSTIKTLLGLVAFAAGFIYLQVLVSQRATQSQVTSSSFRGSGISAFLRFAEHQKPETIMLRRSAVLSAADLEDTGALLILSPEMEISERESEFIKTFVEQGGLLVLSFHREQSWAALESLLKTLSMHDSVGTFNEFRNHHPVITKAPEGIPLFTAGATYAFYSRLVFDNPHCYRGEFSCFVSHASIGRGDVVLISGLPPFSNGLIGVAGNETLAFALLEHYWPIVVDEYRHFFSDRTVSDLVREPVFVLPLVALLGGAILFFALGYSEPREVLDRRRSEPVRLAYHDFSIRALRGISSGRLGEAVFLQGSLLKKRFPRYVGDVERVLRQSIKLSPLAVGKALLALHQEVLREQKGTREIPPTNPANKFQMKG